MAEGERVHGPYKHGNRWRVVVTRADRSQTVESFKTRAEALAVANAARAQSEGRTLMIAVDAYETSLRERKLAGVSVERARRHLERLLKLDTEGHRPLAWLNVKRAATLYDESRAGASVATHRNGLAAGKAFGKWCARRGWLAANPFANVEGVGRRKRGKPQHHVDESRKLIEVCLAENTRESIAVATAFLLGMRATETAVRQVRDLDDGGRLLWIDRTKTDAGRRHLEVPEVLRPYLIALASGRPSTAYLFGASDVGGRPTRYWLHYHCKRLCAVAKVPTVTPQGLRGTHTTLARAAGTTAHVVAAQVGHSSPSMTESAYIAPGTSARADVRTVERLVIRAPDLITNGPAASSK